jgi:TonB family protein
MGSYRLGKFKLRERRTADKGTGSRLAMNRSLALALGLSFLLHAVVFLLVPVGQGTRPRPASSSLIIFTSTDSPAPAQAPSPSPVRAVPAVMSSSAATAIEHFTSAATPSMTESATGAALLGATATASGAADAAVQARYVSARTIFLSLLERHKTYPVRARDKGIEGRVGLAVTLDAEGRAERLDIRRSSGSSLLDQAALNLVRQSLPFPHGLGTQFHAEITIVYQLDKQANE